jgi:hypothetical protein
MSSGAMIYIEWRSHKHTFIFQNNEQQENYKNQSYSQSEAVTHAIDVLLSQCKRNIYGHVGTKPWTERNAVETGNSGREDMVYKINPKQTTYLLGG